MKVLHIIFTHACPESFKNFACSIGNPSRPLFAVTKTPMIFSLRQVTAILLTFGHSLCFVSCVGKKTAMISQMDFLEIVAKSSF